MFKNISIIALGNGLSLLIHLIFFPIIAKLSGPEIFGEYGYLYSIIQVIAIVGLLNLNKLLIASAEKLANNIFTGGIALSILITIVWFTVIQLFDLNFYSFITSPLLLLLMINELLLSNLYRMESFSTITILIIIKKISFSIILFLFVYFEKSLISMIYASLITEFLIFLSVLIFIKNYPIFNLNKLNISSLYNKDFILIKSIQDLLNRLSALLPLIYVKNYISSSETGYYYFANKIIQSPLAIATKSIRSVFFIKLSKNIDSFSNKDLLKISLYYVLFTIIGLFTLLILQTTILELVDSSWSNSYKYFYYLFPMLVSNSMASIFRDRMLLMGENLILLYADIILNIFRILLFVIAINFNMSLIKYIALMAMTIIVFNFITLILSIKTK